MSENPTISSLFSLSFALYFVLFTCLSVRILCCADLSVNRTCISLLRVYLRGPL